MEPKTKIHKKLNELETAISGNEHTKDGISQLILCL